MTAGDLSAAVELTDEAMIIRLPVKPRYGAIGYSLFLLVLLALFGIEALSTMRSEPDLYWPAVLLAGVFLAAMFVIVAFELTWLVIGREVMVITQADIQLSHALGGLSYTKRFAAGAIDGVFVSREPFPRFGLYRDWEWRNFHRGRVALNSGRNLFGVRTFRFGEVLTAEEARDVVAQILERYPQYRYHAD